MVTKTGNFVLEKIGGMRQHSLRRLSNLCKKYKENPAGVHNEQFDEIVLGRIPEDVINALRKDVRLEPLQVRNGKIIIDKEGIQHIIERHMTPNNGTLYNTKQLKSMLNDFGYAADFGELQHIGAYKPLYENGIEYPLFTNAVWSPRKNVLLKDKDLPFADLWHLNDTGNYKVNTVYPKTQKGIKKQQQLEYVENYDKTKRVLPDSPEHKRLLKLPGQNVKVLGK